jgi:hypothetical protein
MAQQQPNSTSAVEAAAIRERLVRAIQAAERVVYFVILSEAKNLSFFFSGLKPKRDSSLRSE